MTGTAGAASAETHLRALGRQRRRATGTVYTPSRLAEFVVERALEGRPELLDGRILDPCCGAGVFLVAALRRMASSLTEAGVDLHSPDGHEAFLSEVAERLRGLDVDEVAVRLSRAAVREEIESLSPGDVPQAVLQRVVRVQDFLHDEVDGSQGPPNLIVGNPPYVPADRLDAPTKAVLRANYQTATGRLDLYTVFMERSASLLALGGRWALITPDKWLASRSAAPLREYLSDEGSVRSVARFDSHSVFDDVATVPCITVWERRPSRQAVSLLDCRVCSRLSPGRRPSRPVVTPLPQGGSSSQRR